MLPPLRLSEDVDEWRWGLEDDGLFSVKSMYLHIDSVFSPEPSLREDVLRVLKNIWKSPAPSKVIAFSWKLVRNRLPTKDNLVLRGIQINGGTNSCVHCNGSVEIADHLFLFCDFASVVSKAIFRWFGVVLIMPPNIISFFEYFIGAASSKKGRHGFYLIWHASVWCLWKSQNATFFSNGVVDSGEVIEAIKLLSWRWGISRHKIPSCLFYEWCWDPELCLLR
jgi:hypothetical protein